MITIIIVVYHSDKKKLQTVLNGIGIKYKIIIVDNSMNYSFKNIKLTNKTKIIRSKNIGNGAGINLGLKKVTTKYAIYFDIDTIFKNNFLEKFLKLAKSIKNFAVLLPNNGKLKSKKKIVEKYNFEGSIMLFNMNHFKKIGFFDDNIFLYFEEIDLFLRCKIKMKKVYVTTNLSIIHQKASSVIVKNKNELIYLRVWHYMWSMFYVYKKHFGYLFALKKCYIYLIKDLIMMSVFFLRFDKLNFLKRFNRISGLITSMLNIRSFKRIK
ncbi:glycosyltransferase [bacterium]|nr:glycosyltransferase [bacterium]